MDEENKNVQEVVRPEDGNTSSKEEQASEPRSENTSSSQEKPKEDSQEKNWREVRQLMKELKEENQYLKSELSSIKSPPPQEDDPLAALEDDDIVNVGDVKKIVAKYAQNATKDLLSKREREREIEGTPQKYSDYFEVIKYADQFEKENPAVAEAITKATNPREAGYQVIKNWLQIKNKINEPSQISQKVEENSKKPLSSQSVGTTSPLNDVRKYERMTPERAAEIQRLAQEYASRQ